MTTLETKITPFASKDLLVKVLASVFLNPGDRSHKGKKIFIQDFLKCGCPDAVVEQASIHFFVRPLADLLEQRIASMEPTMTATALEQEVNTLLKLPKNLKWPRKHNGQLLAPATWRSNAIRKVTSKSSYEEKLIFLRKMVNATIDAVIEVPGRAFFFLVVEERQRLQKQTLFIQYESGQMLYKLMGYNRCRLFTITNENESKIIPEIDTALSWHDLHNAFSEVHRRYGFADHLLQFFKPLK
jgi:hypothetical protein